MTSKKTLNILYIDGDGPLGGASRSLYELIRSFGPNMVRPYFFSSKGTASIFYKKIAIDTVSVVGMPKFDHTRYGYYRGWRWLILLRELYYLPFMVSGILKAARRWKEIDIIHLNEFVYILPAIIAKRLFDAPLVVHVRALTKGNDSSIRSKAFNWILTHFADTVIAIDGNVRQTLPTELDIRVINNSFSPKDSPKDNNLHTILSKIPKSKFKAGFVGNLHKSKGVVDIIQAAEAVNKVNPNVHFIIAGGETAAPKGLKGWILRKLGFAQNIYKEVSDLTVKYNLQENISLTGFTLDISQIYQNIDVLLFPSHFDAPGRPVFEAGFYSKPSIVAVKNPTPDTFIDGITGIAVPEKSPNSLADAILYLAGNPSVCTNMGVHANSLYENNFRPDKNSSKVLDIYHRLAAKHRKYI